jgi:hypothetical protein
MDEHSRVTIMDRDGAIAELKRLAEILWRVNNQRFISPQDEQGVYDILVGWSAVAGAYVTPNDMVQAIFEVTHDLDFAISTVKRLLPDVVVEPQHPLLQ